MTNNSYYHQILWDNLNLIEIAYISFGEKAFGNVICHDAISGHFGSGSVCQILTHWLPGDG